MIKQPWSCINNAGIWLVSTLDYSTPSPTPAPTPSPTPSPTPITPNTVLANDKKLINCSRKEEENIVTIITSFEMQSLFDDEHKIDELFDESSTFINESTNALSEVFVARVEFLDVDQINNINKGIELWMVISHYYLYDVCFP